MQLNLIEEHLANLSCAIVLVFSQHNSITVSQKIVASQRYDILIRIYGER